MIHRSRGFTLLEMMLVIVLLGLVSSLIIASRPGSNSSLRSESEYLFETLRFTAQRAVEENKIYGVVVKPHQWQVVVLSRNSANIRPDWESQIFTAGRWESVRHKQRKLSRSLPENIALQLSIDETPITLAVGETDEALIPNIWFLPGGESITSLFRLTNTQDDQSTEIQVDSRGEVQLLTDDDEQD